MYTEVYADVLFLINFSMDAIALYVSARLCSAKISIKRIVLASTIGGIYSVVSLLLGLRLYFEIAVFMLVCVIMCAVALCPDSFLVAFKYSIVMFVASAMLGGIMTVAYGAFNSFFYPYIESEDGIDLNPLIFALLALISMSAALFLCSLHGSGNLPDRCEIKVTIFKKELVATGIFDSGNMLKDPLSGRSVIIADANLLTGILSKTFLDGAYNNNTMLLYSLEEKEKKRFRLIASKGIGGSTYLWGIIADEVNIVYQKKGKTCIVSRDAVIGLACNCDFGGDFRCIVPTSII